MDQYIVELKANFLFVDLVDLYDLINGSDNENLKYYLEGIKNAINSEFPNTIK